MKIAKLMADYYSKHPLKEWWSSKGCEWDPLMTTLSIPLPGKRIALMMCILSKMLEKVCSF